MGTSGPSSSTHHTRSTTGVRVEVDRVLGVPSGEGVVWGSGSQKVPRGLQSSLDTPEPTCRRPTVLNFWKYVFPFDSGPSYPGRDTVRSTKGSGPPKSPILHSEPHRKTLLPSAVLRTSVPSRTTPVTTVTPRPGPLVPPSIRRGPRRGDPSHRDTSCTSPSPSPGSFERDPIFHTGHPQWTRRRYNNRTTARPLVLRRRTFGRRLLPSGLPLLLRSSCLPDLFRQLSGDPDVVGRRNETTLPVQRRNR